MHERRLSIQSVHSELAPEILVALLDLGRARDRSRLLVQLEQVSDRFQCGHLRLGTVPFRGYLSRSRVVCCWAH